MKRCLIVDDSSVIRKVARTLLEEMRMDVTEAENGQQALDRCKVQLPDIIFLDWHMPVMGAFEFMTAIRAVPADRRPAIIYCTTENDPIDISRAFSAGADDYMMKPFDREMIAAKILELQAVT